MRKVLLVLLGVFGSAFLAAQSPYATQTFSPATVMTATSQTSTAFALGPCGQPNTGTSTQAVSWSSGNITVTGVALTTATFAVLGSSDCGVTYTALAINLYGTPGTVGATATATAAGIYQVNLSGINYIKFQTSGTFTATSISLLLTASPQGIVGRNGSGSGSGVTQLVAGTGVTLSPSGGTGVVTVNSTGGAPCTSTANAVQKNNSGSFGCSTLIDDGTNPVKSPDGLDVVTAGGYDAEYPNAASVGTTVQLLACNDGTGHAVICSHTTSTTNVGLGTVVAGAGTTGNATVCNLGWCLIKFDNTSVPGNYAIGSSTVDGELHDTGSTTLTANQSNYSVWSANSGAGTAGYYRMLTADDFIASAAKNGKGTVTGVTATSPIVSSGGNAPVISCPTCSTGSSVTLQTNGVNNTSQSLLNVAGINGITTTNPSGGVVDISGQNFVQYAANSNVVFVGASRLIIDSTNQTTATAASCNGTICTITDTQSYTAGQWIQFYGTWSPSCFSGNFGTGNHIGITQVLSAGLSGSQFEVNQGSLGTNTCTGTLTGTGGQIQDATNLWPQRVFATPFFQNGVGNTLYNMAVGGQTTAGLITDYTAYIHPLSPTVTGRTGYLFIQSGGQDVLNCTSVPSTVEPNLQSYWNTARADGWTIIELTEIPVYQTNACETQDAQQVLNDWNRSQKFGSFGVTKGWDNIIDVASYFADPYDYGVFGDGTTTLTDHLTDAGTYIAAAVSGIGLMAKSSVPPRTTGGFTQRFFMTDVTGNPFTIVNANGNAGCGVGVYDANSWAFNTAPTFCLGLSELVSPPLPFIGIPEGQSMAMLTFPLAPSSLGRNIIANQGEMFGWNNTYGPFGYQKPQLATSDTCMKKIATGSAGIGSCATVADLTGTWNASQFNFVGVSSDPGSPANGNCWYNSTSNQLKCYINGTTTVLGATTTANALTMNNGGSGAASGTTFDGSVAQTISYNTIGAAPLASPTFTGTPAAPTATGGTNTTQLATTAFVQAAIAAAGTGAGIVTYSGPSLTLTGTQYLPIGGGGLASTTETNVDIDAPAAVTIQNMTVQMSAAPGVGNSVVFTWRKNASSQTLTCTISGASATSCSDTTHSFTTASLDLLDIQAVTTGTIVGTPTLVMAAQVGISATTSTSFSAISTGTNTGQVLTVGNSSSVTPSGTGVVNANQLNAVPFCTGFTPTTGQNLQYTTASSPNPCYTAVSGAFQPTQLPLPPAVGSFTWINQGSSTNSNNGNQIMLTIPYTSALNWRFMEKSTAFSTPWSVAAAYKSQEFASNSNDTGLYLYDGTKLEGIEYLYQGGSVITLRVERITNVTTDNATQIAITLSLYNQTNTFDLPVPTLGIVYSRWRDNGTTLFADYSLDGANWVNFYSESVGTFITPTAYGFGGIHVATGVSTSPVLLDIQGWLETNSATL